MRTTATKLGPWTLLERIAVGGTSEVYRAQGENGIVALKLPRTPRGRDALLHEAKLLEKLEHAGLSTLVACDPRGDWLALELIHGLPLVEWAAERPLEEVVQVLLRVLTALNYLHSQEIVHGDLTPSNVMVRKDGEPILLDLGLAAELDETVPFGFRGTLGYAAPELLKGGVPTPSSDLYAFGAVAYASLAGEPPFNPPDPAALAYLPLATVPPPPSSHRPALAGPIDEVLLELLARSPIHRPDDLRVIAARLWEGSGTDSARPVLGMSELRDTLRRLAVEVLSGETRVVVLYGPPGSGRRTLAEEALRVALREGAEYVEADKLEAAKGKTPAAHTGEASPEFAAEMARAAVASARPTLLIVQTERPVPALREMGASEFTPPPLGRGDTVRLAVAWGAPAERAERWWRDSFGHPASIHGHIRAWLRTQGRHIDDAQLDAVPKQILAILSEQGPSSLPDIARSLRVGEHTLLDHCEVLFAEGRIESAEDGAILRMTSPP
ncbi:MAG: serine/threonine-protein kinase PknK [Proteobacteria bacterium]|nr:serine/threonine-protein kinase PknK [Pseudomonadota bacterium]